MTLILGVAVPVLLFVWPIAAESWVAGMGLAAYVTLILWSETVRKVGRAGVVFAPRGKYNGRWMVVDSSTSLSRCSQFHRVRARTLRDAPRVVARGDDDS